MWYNPHFNYLWLYLLYRDGNIEDVVAPNHTNSDEHLYHPSLGFARLDYSVMYTKYTKCVYL